MGDGGLKEIFLEEAKEILGNLESDIVLLEENDDPEIINRIFRYVHTLKGSSGVAGINEISEFTHKLENLLDGVRSGELEVAEKLIDIILDSMDWIKQTLFEEVTPDWDEMRDALLMRIAEYKATGGKKEEEKAVSADADKEKLTEEALHEEDELLKEEITDDRGEKEIGFRYFRVRIDFKERIFENGIDPLMIMEDLQSLGSFCEKKIDKKKLPDFENLDPEKCYLGWNVVLKTKHSQEKVEEVFLFVKDDNDVVIEDITSNYVIEDQEEKEDSYIEAKKLGEILVDKGITTKDELDDVLAVQDLKFAAEEHVKRVGELAVEKGYASEKDIRYALNEQERAKKKIEVSTVRVDTKKLDKLLNLLGEIVIGQSAISRIADVSEDAGASSGNDEGFRLKNALYGMDRTVREMQGQIMSIRMIPIGPTFEQFRRFVRDSAQSLGKEIKLEIMGKETELDKTVIEKIGDPLKHMIRNAIDHGIETPEERQRSGKDRAGKILLNAYHQEGSVYIEIVDDGRGIDKSRVKERGIKMGLIKAGEEINDEKILSCLFSPGLSTAEKVGDLSGRGVGMDVVKSNIEELRGSVEIETKDNIGSTFRIKLPLTLAIIEGMLVRIGDNIYVIPLLSVVESIQPKKEDIKTVEGKGEVISVREDYISFLRLYDIFGVKPDYVNPWESLVVIVESGGRSVGIMVDDLIGQQQIVIKSLDNFVTKSRSISGASILGDGRVSLIMDVHGLIGELSRATIH